MKSILAVCLFVSSAAAQQVMGGIEQPSLKTPDSSTPPEKRCTVEGKVVNSLTGEPIKKVSVRLTRFGNGAISSMGTFVVGPNQPEGYSAMSGPDGSFHIDGIEPGQYQLTGEHAGYLHSTYGSKNNFGGGTKLTLSPSQQMTGLSFGMMPQAVIVGRVVDGDGDPVGNVQVVAMRQSWANGRARFFPNGNAQTDEEGHFRIASLEPGKYFILAEVPSYGPNADLPTSPDKPDIRPVATYYPQSTTRDNAAAVSVKAGETAPDTEIHMQYSPAHHIRGKLSGTLPGSNENLHLQVRPDNGDFQFGFGFDPRTMLKPDHSFDIPGVTPGRYIVSVMLLSGSIRNVAEAHVEVGETDVNGVELVSMQPGTMHGQIVVQGKPASGADSGAVKQVRIFLSPDDPSHVFFGAQSDTQDDGSFTIQNVTPGKYTVNVHNPIKGTYTQSIVYGSQDILHKTLDLSASVGGELQVVLRYGVAQVSGVVTSPDNSGPDANGSKKIDATVYLIPQIDSNDRPLYSAMPDQNGSFTVSNLPPGTYRAVAVEGVSYQAMENPDFNKELSSRGIEIELKENDKKQQQLQVIGVSDVQQIYQRLGIEPE